MVKITALHFDISGDCTGALAALSNTESAINRVSGLSASPSVSVIGAGTAISQLSAVADAATDANAAVSISADTRGLAAAQQSVSSLRGDIQDMNRDISSVGGLDVGVTGGGAIQGMSGFVRGLSGAVDAASASFSTFADSGGRASSIGSQMASDFSNATRATEAHTAALQDHRAVVQGLTDDHRELASVGAQAQNAAGGMQRDAFQRIQGALNADLKAEGADWRVRTVKAPGTGGGGPPGGGGGGGGGGGRGATGGGGGGGDDDGGGMGGFHNMWMLPAVGAMEPLLTGAGGLMAVKEAIKDVPELAAAQKVAMLDFQSGIYQAAQAASGVGVPEILALGQTLHGLGGEIGSIGSEHMSAALSGITDLAGEATQTLKALDPAIASSMQAVFGIGDALLAGIANPSTVAAINTTANAIADASNVRGFGDLVSSFGTLAATTATPAANILGTAGNILGDFGPEGEGPAASAGFGGVIGSKMFSRDAASALKSGKSEIGKGFGATTGAGIFAIAAAEQQAGMDPTAGMLAGGGGAAIAKMAGLGGPEMLLMAGLGEGAAFLAQTDPAISGGGDSSGRTSTAAGGAFAAPKSSGSGSYFAPDMAAPSGTGADAGWRNSTLLGQALDALGVSRSLSGPTGPRPDWQSGSALLQEADKEFAAGQDPFGGPKGPAADSPEGIHAKVAAAQKASAADPTNLGLYQQAAFAKAVEDARRTSKNNDDPMAAFMAQGPGGGGGGGQIVGAQGGGTWTSSGGGVSGGGGGSPFGGIAPPSPSPIVGGGGADGGGGGGGGGAGPLGPVIPKGPGSSGATMGASDMAGLGVGPSPASGLGPAGGPGADTPGGPYVPPGAGTPGGSDRLGGNDPRPTGGLSPGGEVTLSSGWGPGGVFQPGVPGGGSQVLSSLTDLRSTASNMFGAMGGLPGGGPEAAALRRDWAATQNVAGGSSSDNVANAQRFLASDIQRASQSIADGGQVAQDRYADNLANQNHLERAPATGVSSAAVGGQSLPGGPALYSGLGDAPMSNLGQQLSALGGRPGAPGEVTDIKTSPSAAQIFADYQSQPHSVGDLRWGGPSITSEGPPPGWMQPGGYDPVPTNLATTPGITPHDPAMNTAMLEPGGYRPGGVGMGAPTGGGFTRYPQSSIGEPYKGPLGPGSAGPAGAAQLDKLNAAYTSTTAKGAQFQQQNTALTQSLQKVGQGSEQTGQQAQSLGQHAQSIQQVASAAGPAASSVNNLGDSLKNANAAAASGGSGVGAAMASGGGGGDTGLSGFAASVGTGASAAAKGAGEATASAFASGMAQANEKVGTEASAMGSIAANAASLQLKAHSPSQVFYDLGTGTGDGMVLGIHGSMPAVAAAVGGGLAGVLDGARGVASDYGLAVGFSYVENITTGAQQAIKSADFQQLSTPDIKSPLAKAALGAMGLLGPAGAGAQSYQLAAREVSFGAGSAAQPAMPTQFTFELNVDGAPMKVIAQKLVSQNMGQLADALHRQRSA